MVRAYHLEKYFCHEANQCGTYFFAVVQAGVWLSSSRNRELIARMILGRLDQQPSQTDGENTPAVAPIFVIYTPIKQPVLVYK